MEEVMLDYIEILEQQIIKYDQDIAIDALNALK